MRQRKLGGLEVSALGLGCMGMSEFYGSTDDSQSTATIRRALDLGVTFLDTSDMYGSGHNEQLVGGAIAGRRDEVQLATKFAIRRDDNGRAQHRQPARVDPRGLRRVPAAPRRGPHRPLLHAPPHPEVPIEESVGAMGELVAAGKVRQLGLSEVSPDTLRAAHATHPIAALQSEWSLFTRDLEEEIVPTARELGVAIVALQPARPRGALRPARWRNRGQDDFRRFLPRFQEGNREHNLGLAARVREIAAEVGCTPVQLALAWLLQQGEDVVPIPGTKREQYLEENAAAVDMELTPEQLQELDEAVPRGAVSGDRYPAESMATVER